MTSKCSTVASNIGKSWINIRFLKLIEDLKNSFYIFDIVERVLNFSIKDQSIFPPPIIFFNCILTPLLYLKDYFELEYGMSAYFCTL